MRRERTGRGAGALLALAALAVFGSLIVYEWAEAGAEEQPSDQSAPSPETRDSQPSSPPGEPAEPAPVAERVEELQVGEPGSGEPGPLSAAQEQAMTQGYLVPDQEAYDRLKAEANARAE